MGTLASSVTGRCGVGSTALVTGPLSSVCCASYCCCWSMVRLPSHYALEVGVPVDCQPWIRSGIGASTHALSKSGRWSWDEVEVVDACCLERCPVPRGERASVRSRYCRGGGRSAVRLVRPRRNAALGGIAAVVMGVGGEKQRCWGRGGVSCGTALVVRRSRRALLTQILLHFVP